MARLTGLHTDTGVGDGSAPRGNGGSEQPAILSAVREDIRQTLRTAWIDPALEVMATSPVFFTAAWSAVRPNVGKSFLALAKAIRTEAVDLVTGPDLDPPDLRKRLEARLSDEELLRLEETVRALHLAAAKAQIVVHAYHRVVRRERVPGSGREESPIRRGVPEWQRWMSFQPMPDDSQAILGRAARDLGLPGPNVPMRMLARWPAALSAAWDELRPRWRADRWRTASVRLRRLVASGVATLPHPMDLQWAALKARGLTEEDRAVLSGAVAPYEAAMPTQTLTAALLWSALGSPEIGPDG